MTKLIAHKCAAVGCSRKVKRLVGGFCFQHADMAKPRKYIAPTPELFEDRLVTLMAEVNECAADYMAECHALRRDLCAIRDIAERAVTLGLSGRIPSTYVMQSGVELSAEAWLDGAKRYLGGDKSVFDFSLQPPEE